MSPGGITMTDIGITRTFTPDGATPADVFSSIEWAIRDAKISDQQGNVAFEQRGVEFPLDWSQTAINVVASKYFKGKLGTDRRETSVRGLINRVVDTIADWGRKLGHLADHDNYTTFRAELTYLLVNQYGCFNSPVWFNVGITDQPSAGWVWDHETDHVRRVEAGEHRPQCSACFIVEVDDNMESILDWVKTEGMIFKYGSGSGVNVSTIRSTKEFLSSGGKPSGPLSFMLINDTAAGSIKSGGTHRRAAKMVVLNADHPDILEFINCKVEAENMADKLVEIGYSKEFNAEKNAYSLVPYQNANNSVRVTDKFMAAAASDETYWTKEVSTGAKCEELVARDVLWSAAEATHRCGDPGMQFHDTINNWHTCRDTAEIVASNPCSEYMFLNNTACNLSSLNLMKFRLPGGGFDVERFKAACAIFTVAKDIIVDMASYPTKEMAERSHNYRTLGLGFANLGSLLMAEGVPYDSDEGRNMAAAITALMTGHAYRVSSLLARKLGPFPEFANNSMSMRSVIRQHVRAAASLYEKWPSTITSDAIPVWGVALSITSGYRNAQVTVLAPTGTIGFMMDCDTTGIEPELGIVKYKKLVGGGGLKLVNGTVDAALVSLGYSTEQVAKWKEQLINGRGIEELDGINKDHIAIFDTSMAAPGPNARSIHYMGHIKMMAACQPFLSGAISKTINMPESASVQDIFDAYMHSWKLGLKAVAIYRDNCKGSQPLSTMAAKPAAKEHPMQRQAVRELPDTRSARTHKFSIASHKGYVTVGLYEDGTPGEVFIQMAKEGSTVAGLMDSFSIAISYALQHGVPLDKLVRKFSHTQFEPSGYSTNPEIGYAKSIVDYIFRWLELEFSGSPRIAAAAATVTQADPAKRPAAIGPPCTSCGNLTRQSGSCFACMTCGSTTGCS